MYDVEPERLGEFESLEKAEEELAKYKTEISQSGGLFSVTEYMIQENRVQRGRMDQRRRYLELFKMEIEVVDNETLELICTAENYEEAEKIAEDYAEEAGAHLML